MSIAVATVVHPSKLLFTLKIGMSFFVLLMAIVITLRWVGNLQSASTMVLAGVCFITASLILAWAFKDGKPIYIDISGTGQIRVTDERELAVFPLVTKSKPIQDSGELVQLMANSTLWPHLLLLRLKTKDQQVKILTVLPDSVGVASFRALSVACRWIAAHNDSGERANL